MEFKVKNDELAKALGIVKGTFGSKSFPSLNNIYFEADTKGEVIIKASNAHETSTTKMAAIVTKAGKVLIDGFTITRVISTFADGDITFNDTHGNHSVFITHPTGELEILGEDPANFLHPTPISESSSFMIPSKEFKEALESVAFARASNHLNTKLNGIAIVVDNGKTSLFASDTTRVAKYVFDTPAAADINVIVGTEVIKGLASVTGNIAVKLSDKGVIFETNESSYQAAVLTTNFPPQVNNYFTLPEQASLVVDKAALKDMLTRVSILSKAGKDDPHAEFEFKDTGELEIKFHGTRGKIKSEKMITTHTGKSITLNLSVDKVIESVNKIEKDRLDIVFPKGKNDQVKAINVFPEGNRDFGIFNMAVSA